MSSLTSPVPQFSRQEEDHCGASSEFLEQESSYDGCIAHDKEEVALKVVAMTCLGQTGGPMFDVHKAYDPIQRLM